MTDPAADWAPRPLRVGLLIDSYEQPCWIHDAIAEVNASGVATVVVVVVRDAAAAPRRRRNPITGIWRHRHELLYLLYRRLDEWRFKVVPDPFEPTDIQSLVADAAVVTVTPRQTEFVDRFEPADLDRLRGFDLDVAVRFGFRILKGDVLGIARFGIWSYHHGDNLVNRGGPAGFWEVMEGNPVTGSILQVLSEDLDGGRVLYRSWSATDPVSVRRNRAGYYWKTATFLARKLRQLHAEGPAAIHENAPADRWAAYGKRLYRAPGNWTMFRLMVRLARRFVARRLEALLVYEQWLIAYTMERGWRDGAEPTPPALHRSRLISLPKGSFWADPFVVRHGDGHLVFFEEFIDATWRGHISVFEIDSTGVVGPARRIIEQPYHMSYPFPFEWGGEHYLLPETSANRTIELYRATNYPDEWVLDRVLMDGLRAVDATLAEIDGQWWMFVNIAPNDGSSSLDELHLFHADSPLGPWTPHRHNPVVTDVRSARPAGSIIHWRGAWYRPSQDCSTSYGSATVINRIVRIDRDAYEEREVSRIEPDWRPRLNGTHTVNSDGAVTVVDLRLKRSRLF